MKRVLNSNINLARRQLDELAYFLYQNSERALREVIDLYQIVPNSQKIDNIYHEGWAQEIDSLPGNLLNPIALDILNEITEDISNWNPVEYGGER